MTLQPITTTKQFIASTVLVTLAFFFLVINQGRLAFLFLLPLQAANLVAMPSETRQRPLTPRQLLGALGVVLVAAAWIWWTVTHRTPESDAWDRSLADSFSHPAWQSPYGSSSCISAIAAGGQSHRSTKPPPMAMSSSSPMIFIAFLIVYAPLTIIAGNIEAKGRQSGLCLGVLLLIAYFRKAVNSVLGALVFNRLWNEPRHGDKRRISTTASFHVPALPKTRLLNDAII